MLVNLGYSIKIFLNEVTKRAPEYHSIFHHSENIQKTDHLTTMGISGDLNNGHFSHLVFEWSIILDHSI